MRRNHEVRGASTTRPAIDEQGIGAISVGLLAVGTPGTERERIIYLHPSDVGRVDRQRIGAGSLRVWHSTLPAGA